MKINLGSALSFPTVDPGGPKKFLIGCLLVCFCWLFLPALIGFGYALEVIRQISEGEDTELPTWDRCGDYLARGWWAFLIGLAFFAVPAVLYTVGIGGIFVGLLGAARTETLAPAAGGLGFGAICVISATIISFVVSFFVPISLLRYARSLKIGDAFNFGELLSDIGKAPLDYLVTWGVPLALLMCGNMALGSLHVIPVLGTFASALLQATLTFYVGVAWAHLLGQYYRAHLIEDLKPAEVSEF